MAKARSPQYPAIGLKEAVDKINDIYQQDYQNPISREVAAAHMGYKGLNGKSLGILSALGKYGLLAGRGNDSHVSDLAVRIIAHPHGDSERGEAIKEAASKPTLFEEIENRFQSGNASDQAIRSYLLTQKFIPAAADAAIRSYRETKQFVESESISYDSVLENQTINPVKVGIAVETNQALPVTPVLSEDGYRVSMTASGIEVAAVITSKQALKKLIRLLQLNEGALDATEEDSTGSVDDDLSDLH